MIRRQEDGIIAALKSSSHPWDDPGFEGLVRTGSPSRFQDDIWEQPVHVRTQRRGHVRIRFNVELGNGECLTDPHLADLLWASKCFIWSLMHCGTRGKGGAPSTVRSSWDKFLALIKWMREYSYDSFEELEEDAIRDYVQHVKESKATSVTKSRLLKVLLDLYLHQERLPEGFRLLNHPFAGDIDPQRFGKAARQEAQSIPHVPDEVIIPVLMEARRWIEDYSSDVIRLTEEAHLIGATPGSAEYASKRKRLALIRSFRPSAGETGGWYTSPLRGVHDLLSLQHRLHAAAIIVIGCFAGLRLHEVLALDPGCIRGPVVSEDGTMELFYLRGTTVKISPRRIGHDREWVAGARPAATDERVVVVEAIRALEALHRAARVRYGGLLFSTKERNTGYSVRKFQSLLNDFFALVPAAEGWQPTSHQFRKTFARFVSRYDTNHNAALAQQLGHVRLAMTDAYAAKDLDLVRLLEREHAEVVSDGFMALLRAEEMAGKRGEEIVRSVARLRAKIADEAEFIAICGRLGRDANIVLHLGEHGACYFRQSTAACGGTKAPNLAVRTPTMCLECENLVVTEEHRPFWERRVQDNERLLQDYPDAWPALVEKWTGNVAKARRLLAKLAASREILTK